MPASELTEIPRSKLLGDRHLVRFLSFNQHSGWTGKLGAILAAQTGQLYGLYAQVCCSVLFVDGVCMRVEVREYVLANVLLRLNDFCMGLDSRGCLYGVDVTWLSCLARGACSGTRV